MYKTPTGHLLMISSPIEVFTYLLSSGLSLCWKDADIHAHNQSIMLYHLIKSCVRHSRDRSGLPHKQTTALLNRGAASPINSKNRIVPQIFNWICQSYLFVQSVHAVSKQASILFSSSLERPLPLLAKEPHTLTLFPFNT